MLDASLLVRRARPDVPSSGAPVAVAVRPPESAPAVVADVQPPAVAAPRLQATEADQRIARQKAAFVWSVYNLAQDTRVSVQDACTAVACRTQDFGELVTGGKGGASLLAGSRAYANYRSWAAKLGQVGKTPAVDNWQELLPGYVGSRGYQRPGEDAFWTVLANLYENANQPPLAQAYQHACRLWRAGHPAGADAVPTYDQVRHYYKHHVDQKRVMVSRMGSEWFLNNVATYIRREAPDTDEAWVGDHHKLDIACRTWDAEKCAWVPTRPWLTAWLDWGSMYFIGWVIRDLEPNRDSIERSLRLALAANQLHPPTWLYTDNGKDYQARGLTTSAAKETSDRADSIAAAIGCAVKTAIPYNAKAKVIERRFRDVCAGFSKFWGSYRGNCPANRPEHAADTWGNPDTLPTVDQVAAAFAFYLEELHNTAGEGKALAGRSPKEARKDFARPRPALDALSIHRAFLREVGMREIRRGGAVLANNREYQSEELYALLGNSSQVLVKTDPDDVDTVYCFDAHGREIGPAKSIRLLAALIGEDAPKETIEDLRAGIRAPRAQLRSAKADSAEARGLTRYTANPEHAARLVHGHAAPLPPPPARLPASPSAPREVAPAEEVADFAAAMAAATQGRLATAALTAELDTNPGDTAE